MCVFTFEKQTTFLWKFYVKTASFLKIWVIFRATVLHQLKEEEESVYTEPWHPVFDNTEPWHPVSSFVLDHPVSLYTGFCYSVSCDTESTSSGIYLSIGNPTSRSYATRDLWTVTFLQTLRRYFSIFQVLIIRVHQVAKIRIS